MNDKEKCELADFVLSVRGKKEIIISINGKAVKVNYGQMILKKKQFNDEEKCKLADFITETCKDKMLICLDNRMIRIDLDKLRETINKNL
jgi:hypothetical protein